MNVSGGLIGITQNKIARNKFFLVSPEMAQLAAEAENMAGLSTNQSRRHHEDSPAILKSHKSNVQKLADMLSSYTNLFAEEKEMINLITKTIMPSNIRNYIWK